jgi:hypothetical protein
MAEAMRELVSLAYLERREKARTDRIAPRISGTPCNVSNEWTFWPKSIAN